MAVILRHLPIRTHSSWGGWLKELVQWLTGVHPTYDGPGWELVECDDTTLREVPSGTTSDDLSGGNLWNPSTGTEPPTGSWVVLQLLAGAIPPNNAIQIMFYVNTSTTVYGYMFVLSDFVTGGGTTAGAIPVIPAVSSATTQIIKPRIGYMRHYALADQSMMAMGSFDETDADDSRWWYVGELDVPATFGTDAEPRNKYPYVIRNSYAGGFESGTANAVWIARSPFDVNVEIGTDNTARIFYPMYAPNTQFLSRASPFYQEHEGVLMPFSAGVRFTSNSNGGTFGYFRHHWACAENPQGLRFTAGLRHFVVNDPVQSHIPILVSWDGTTGLPTGQVSGT